MNRSTYMILMTTLASLIPTGCKNRASIEAGMPQSLPSEAAQKELRKVILFGDIQLAGAYRFNQDLFAQKPISKSILVNSSLRESDFDENNPLEALKAEEPDLIINTGDIVDLNNGQRFQVQDKQGNQLEQWTWEVDEWETILKRFRQLRVPIFPTAGNHEGYKTVQWTFQKEDSGSLRFVGSSITGNDGSERQSILRQRFPELTGTQVSFLAESASYFADQGTWCLLSLDVNSFAYPDKPLAQILSDKNAKSDEEIQEWKQKYESAINKAEKERQRAYEFAREKIRSCQGKDRTGGHRPVIVLTHFPFFSGKKDLFKDDNGREKHGAEFHDEGIRKMFVSLFDDLNVALVIGAHEHFYLRYLEAGFDKADYRQPKSTTYFNTSTFGGSFTSEGVDRILKLGRLNETGKIYDRIESTPMVLEDRKSLRIKTGPTYSSLIIAADSITVTSKGFDYSTKSWKKFDEFRLDKSGKGDWVLKESPN